MSFNQSLPRPRPVSPTDTSTSPMDSNQFLPRAIGPTDTNSMGTNQSYPVSPTDTNPMGSHPFLPPPSSPMGSHPSLPRPTISPMDTKQRRLPKIQFRVLIIGRANAGKTTILQRVCDTTESPTIYRRNIDGEREQVRPGSLTILPVSSNATQVALEPTMEVSDKRCCLPSLLNSDSAWRARYR